MKPIEDLRVDPLRYYLTPARRHALWTNELAMFLVLAMPIIVAAFWYGSTVRMVGNDGQITVPSSVSRGVGLALLISLVVVVGGALRLFIQPAAERVANAQPVRGYRRLSFAAFDGLLVGLITYQSLPDFGLHDQPFSGALSLVVGIGAGLLAFASMLSMVDIPSDTETDWLRARRDAAWPDA